MIRVAITQRVDIIASYGERRDALDQQWSAFFRAAGLMPILVPNQPELALSLVDDLGAAGVLLTGGNDLAVYGGDAPERDETERLLVEWALASGRPVLGVCRGMQLIQHLFDVPLERIEGHVCRSQTIEVEGQRTTVNSFHNFGTTETAAELEVWARSDDGIVKGVRHRSLPLEAFMWHPERMNPFRPEDVEFVKAIFTP
ncbi:MAG: gamma-glutamyl-gamma-aminobutyrate hydrolase PuuD [Myxococcota bacterium]|jgi:gamma-glutamyl-gamma-aminobutyrate hydrolase PuuD